MDIRVSFRGGGSVHPSLALACLLPLLGTLFWKHINSSVLKYLIVTLSIINVHKSLKYCMYMHYSCTTIFLVFYSIYIPIIISKSSSVNNELMSLYYITMQVSMNYVYLIVWLWLMVTLVYGVGTTIVLGMKRWIHYCIVLYWNTNAS